MSELQVSKHFVRFFSPGTFMAETTDKPITRWDVEEAQRMARNIVERYNARPYAFQFITRGRGKDDLDSKVIETSCTYYLGGRVRTLEEVEAENDPKEGVLRSNMRCNGYKRVISTTKGWGWTQPLRDNDVVLPDEPENAVG